MGIAEIIQRKKGEFFAYRDNRMAAADLQRQKDIVVREQSLKKMEEREADKQHLVELKTRERELRGADAKRFMGNLNAGIEKMSGNTKKVGGVKSIESPFGGGASTQNTNSPFYTGGVMGAKKKR